jgi:hypothetical protein
MRGTMEHPFEFPDAFRCSTPLESEKQKKPDGHEATGRVL